MADPRDLVAIVPRKGRMQIAIYGNFVALSQPMGAHLGLKLGASQRGAPKVTHLR